MNLHYPVPRKWPISSSFQDHLNRKPPSAAPGIDIACPSGTEIVAPDTGTIQSLNWTSAGGRGLWLRCHDARYYFAHLSSTFRFVGERVGGGKLLALSDNTGKSTGPHLHLSVKRGGQWIDPWRHFHPQDQRRLEYIGVHVGNHVTEIEADFLGTHINLVKGLMRLDKPINSTGDDDALDVTDWHRLRHSLPDDSMFVLRAYTSMRDGPMPHSVFCHLTMQRLIPLMKAGPLAGANVRLEIHNEPNHPIEGWGPSEEGAILFNSWYRHAYNEIARQLKMHDIPNVKLMWPGLAVGEWSHKERTWMRICEDSIINSPSVGVHCYWQTRVDNLEQMAHPQLGMNWKAYDNLLKDNEIVVTEAGNSNCHSNNHPNLTPQQQADQYVLWCKNARDGVNGVAFFIYGLMPEWEGFSIHWHTVERLGAYLKTIG